MKIGVDVGYLYTKSCFGIGDIEQDCDIFKSTLREDKLGLGDSIHVKIEDKEYTVGDNKGTFSADLNRIDDPVFKVCLFTAIARAIEKSKKNNINDDYDNIQLITGLPAGEYKKQKKELVKSLLGQDVVMGLGTNIHTFTIDKVAVFPQSSGVFLLEKIEDDVLVIDWGSKTVDCSLFSDMQLIDYKTYRDTGMLSLYGKIVKDINDNNSVNLNPLKGEKIVRDKRVYFNDKWNDYNPDNIVNSHMNDVFSLIKSDFPFSEARKIFIGGGSLDLKRYLSNSYEVKADSLYTNAKAFYEVAVQKF